MSETSTLIGYSGRTIGREELTLVPTPAGNRNTPARFRITKSCKLWSRLSGFATSASSTTSTRFHRMA